MEPLPQNNRTINRISKQTLKRAHHSPDPSCLYCLQTAKWSIEKGFIKTRFPQLEINLDALLYEWSPKIAMRLLEGEHNLMSDLPKDPTAAMIGAAVLEQLHSRLAATLPGYPGARDLPANFR